MPLGTNHMTLTTQDKFIPELWSDEVVAAYKTNLVMANLVTKINHNGKKGDTIHLPAPTRGSASAKAASTEVTLIANTETELSFNINKHYEYSRLIEDIVAVQALDSQRAFYTDDAGFALAKKVDQDLMLLLATAQGGLVTDDWDDAVIGSDGSTAFDATASTNTGNGAALSDAGIRQVIQGLDDSDTPMQGRVLVIPPAERNNIMGLARFTEQAFTGEAAGGNTIRTGMIGNLYGIPVFITTNCPWVHVNSVTGTTSTTFSSAKPTGASHTDELGNVVDWNTSTPTDVAYRVAAMFHKEAFVHIEQMGVRSQTQYIQQYLGDLFTADTIYGVGEMRDTAAYPIIVAS